MSSLLKLICPGIDSAFLLEDGSFSASTILLQCQIKSSLYRLPSCEYTVYSCGFRFGVLCSLCVGLTAGAAECSASYLCMLHLECRNEGLLFRTRKILLLGSFSGLFNSVRYTSRILRL